MSELRKINARSCEIKSVPYQEEKDFLDENHRQKYAKAFLSYGLYTKEGELVQILTFGKPRFNRNYQWEIIRDCSKKDCMVRGGVSKLWKYFLKECDPVESVICYSYPHDVDHLFTEKYIDNCGFVNKSKAKPAKKIYFEGIWKGENKRIDKSILERQGVDRLLKTKQGQDRTNEQILLDLGFEKKFEDGFTPQVDIWYSGGCVNYYKNTRTGDYTVEPYTVYDFNYNLCKDEEPWTLEKLKEIDCPGDSTLSDYILDEKVFENPDPNVYMDLEGIEHKCLKDDFKNSREVFDYAKKFFKKHENDIHCVEPFWYRADDLSYYIL